MSSSIAGSITGVRVAVKVSLGRDQRCCQVPNNTQVTPSWEIGKLPQTCLEVQRDGKVFPKSEYEC